MQQPMIVSLFVLFFIIAAPTHAMDIPTDKTPRKLNAIEQMTHDLAWFIRHKGNTLYCQEDTNRARSLIAQGALLDNDLFYPLHDAVRYNQEILVADLLRAGAEVNRTENGKTPLFIACKKDIDPSIMQLLLKKNADVNRDYNGNTALHRLVLSLTKGASRQKVMDKICHLLHAGISLMTVDNSGLTPAESLQKLGLLEENACKIDTINQLLIQGASAECHRLWLEELQTYEIEEKIGQEQRFEEHIALTEEFKDGLYRPTAGNVGRSDSCPEYPRFSMFTLTE